MSRRVPLIALAVLLASPLQADAETPSPTSTPAAVPTPAPPGPGDTERHTLESLQAAIENDHPLMDAARAGLSQLEARLSQAEWAIFPSFKLTGTATITPTLTGDPLSFESSWDTVGVFGSVRLEMVQPLWTFGKISALQAAATAGVEVGKATLEVARWELRVRSAEAWLGRLLGRELDAILVDGQSWIQKAEKRMEKLKAEDSDEYDQLEHLRLKTRVAEFWQLAYDNKMLVQQSQEGMRLLLRKPRGTTIEMAEKDLEPYKLTVLSADAYVEIMRKNDPSLALARRGAKAQQELATARGRELLPDFVLVGQAGIARANQIEDQHSPFANDPFNNRVAGAALGLRWELDVAQKVFQRDEARARARRAKAEAMAQEDLQEFKVRGLALDLKNKSELLTISAESQKAAQGWLTATWDTYDAGFGTFRDVMDALVQFYQQKFGYLKLVFDHNLVAWKLSQAIGVDVRTLGPEPTEGASKAGTRPETARP